MGKDILVLGIGNILQKDDGVGCAIIQTLLDSHITDKFPNVDFIDGGTYGFNLLPFLVARKHVIIIDALNVKDTPGSIYHYPLEHIKKNKSGVFHSFNISELFFHLQLLGFHPQIDIVGIVPENFSTMAIELSKNVQNSIPKAIDYIVKLLKE